MNRKVFACVVVLFAFLFLSSCDLIATVNPEPIDQATNEIIEPTEVPSQIVPSEVPQASDTPQAIEEPIMAANTDTPVPTENAPGQYEAVEVGPDFWLTYDPQLWKRVGPGSYDYLVSKSMETCQIKFQFGHGIDFQRFQPEISQKQFGNMVFEIKRWYPVDNPSETILYGYYSGDIYISIEDSVASPIADECIAQVDDVLRLSVDKSFKKD